MGEGPPLHDHLILGVVLCIVCRDGVLGLGLDGEDNVSTRGGGHAGLVLIQGFLQGGNIDKKAGVGLPVVVQILSLVLDLPLKGAAEVGHGALGGGVGGVGKDGGG